jgi:hypothetical protein
VSFLALLITLFRTASSLSSGTNTKILFDTKEFDTNNNFASSRFTPTVAGYYQISSSVAFSNATSSGYSALTIFKNGSAYKTGCSYASSSNSPEGFVSSVVYCNGSTDYVEIYGYVNSGITTGTGINYAWFNGVMVRGA